VFAVATRDYGWMVTDTSGWAASFQLLGGANPATAHAWRGLGIDIDGNDLLFGLFTKARMWTVEPPTNYCASGPTQQGCVTARSHTP
jgi:hypothetical protein